MAAYIYGRPAKIIFTFVALVLLVVIAQANGFGSALPPSRAASRAGPQPLAPSGADPVSTGDVGPNNYVQIVNTTLQIFNKSGTSVYGPAANNTQWAGFGGPCETRNDGDPIVMYDPMADRWLISQFTTSNPYGECIAIS